MNRLWTFAKDTAEGIVIGLAIVTVIGVAVSVYVPCELTVQNRPKPDKPSPKRPAERCGCKGHGCQCGSSKDDCCILIQNVGGRFDCCQIDAKPVGAGAHNCACGSACPSASVGICSRSGCRCDPRNPNINGGGGGGGDDREPDYVDTKRLTELAAWLKPRLDAKGIAYEVEADEIQVNGWSVTTPGGNPYVHFYCQRFDAGTSDPLKQKWVDTREEVLALVSGDGL